MLYSLSMLRSSYRKNEEILNRFHAIYPRTKDFGNPYYFILLNNIENRKYDGNVTIVRDKKIEKECILEMKQRQDYFIQHIFEEKPEYENFQLIATHFQDEHHSENIQYLIYDLSMRYLLFLDTDNIDYDNEVNVRSRYSKFQPIKKWCCKGTGKIIDLKTGETKEFDLSTLKIKK